MFRSPRTTTSSLTPSPPHSCLCPLADDLLHLDLKKNMRTQITICWTLFFTLLPPALFNTFRLVCDHCFCTASHDALLCQLICIDFFFFCLFFCFVLFAKSLFPTWCTCGFFMYILGSQSAAVFKLKSSPVCWLNSENQVASFIFKLISLSTWLQEQWFWLVCRSLKMFWTGWPGTAPQYFEALFSDNSLRWTSAHSVF